MEDIKRIIKLTRIISVFVVLSIITNAVLIYSLWFSSSSSDTIKVSSAGTVNSQCSICVMIYKDIQKNYIGENPTDSVIEKFITSDYCMQLPSSLERNKCEFITNNKEFRFYLKRGASATDFCRLLGDCP